MYNIKIKSDISACHKPLLTTLWQADIMHLIFTLWTMYVYTENLSFSAAAKCNQARAVKCMFETLPSKLLQQGCCLLGCVGSWDQVTFIFLALRWGILVVTYSKMLQKCKKLSYTKLRILCWRCTFTSKTLWQMPEPSWWLCRNICHCSPFSRGKLLQIKSWWISKYTL